MLTQKAKLHSIYSVFGNMHQGAPRLRDLDDVAQFFADPQRICEQTNGRAVRRDVVSSDAWPVAARAHGRSQM